MCRTFIVKLQCKKSTCTVIYGSFRDDDRTEYCELAGYGDPNHRVSQRSTTEKGDEYCYDCEARISTNRLNRQIAAEQDRINREYDREMRRQQEREEAWRQEEERRREADRREAEQRQRDAEEYRRTGRWPGVDMQSGFYTSRGHNARRRR